MTKKGGNFKNLRAFRIKVIIITFSLLCLISSSGNALWIGQSQLNPFLEIRGGYVSNVFRTNENFEEDESDIVTVVSPGLSFLYPTWSDPKIKLTANFRSTLGLFSLDGDSVLDANGQLNSVAHRLDGFLHFNLTSGIRFNFGTVASLTSNPPDFPGDSRDYFYLNEPSASLSYAFAERYEIQLGYRGRLRRYVDEEFERDNYDRNGVNLTGFYKVFSRSSLLLGGSYDTIDRKDAAYADSTEYVGYVGVRYEATERTSGILKIGGLERNFDDDRQKPQSGWYASGNLDSAYSERTHWGLNLDRRTTETTTANDTGKYGSFVVVTSFGAHASHTMTSLPNLSFSTSLGFSDNRFPDGDPERDDQVYFFTLGADYRAYKYLSLGLSYRYTRRDSNIEIYDYNNNIASINIRGVI